MASGSTITATGMLTMTQVVAGTDEVSPDDFNNARTNVDRLFGIPQDVTLGTFNEGSTYGWRQGGVGVNAVATSDLIYANQSLTVGFKNLQDDVQAMCSFLGVTLRAGVGTDVNTSNEITAATWNNLMLNVRDCWINRFSPATATNSTDASATRTTQWVNTLTQVTTWTFANETDCRAFFNCGGALGITASRTGGSATTQNTSWSTKLTNLGEVWLRHDTSEAAAGTISGVGFYELTTTNQQLVEYFGGASPYANDVIRVYARVNSTTDPTQVIITTELVDSDDGIVDAPVDGTLTINARRQQPNPGASGFTFPVPTDSVGAITGS